MSTIQSGTRVEEFNYRGGKIAIIQTPMTRFGVLYFPTFDKKENDKSLSAYKVTAYSTITKGKTTWQSIIRDDIDAAIKNSLSFGEFLVYAANDEYIRNLALMIKNDLDPELKVYVEYSNEIWNWMFPQTTYCFEQGDQSKEWPERIVPFVQNTLDIFSQVFADDMDRLERVVGTQHAWIDVSDRIASNMRENSFDILSPAAYFGITSSGYEQLLAAGKNADIAMVKALAIENIDTEAFPLMLEQAAIANRLGVKLAFYEGGQHLTPEPFGTEQSYGSALVNIQFDESIYDLYSYWFELLASIEVENNESPIEFVNYSLASGASELYGTWGIFPSIFEQEISKEATPKYQAIIDFMAK